MGTLHWLAALFAIVLGWILLRIYWMISAARRIRSQIVDVRLPIGPRPLPRFSQTVEIRRENSNESPVRRVKHVGATAWPPPRAMRNGASTLFELFESSIARFPTHDCLGSRGRSDGDERTDYHWLAYSEVGQRRKQFGSGLLNLGVERGDRIGIYSQNREEWIITEQACYSYSLVVVSFYDTFGSDAVEFVAHHSEAKVAVCDESSTHRLVEIARVRKSLGKEWSLHTIVQFERVDASIASMAEDVGLCLVSFADVLRAGAEDPHDFSPPRAEDLCTIMYTSGTTGSPKGALLTHGNIISGLRSAEPVLGAALDEGAVHLSYLPLAHIFERVIVSLLLAKGGSVGFYQGDVRLLMDDLKALKPTVFVGVPRVYGKIVDRVKHSLRCKPFYARYATKAALRAAERSLETGQPISIVWEALVLNEIRSRLGGRVRAMISGSAPLPFAVHRFLMVAFGVPVIQGYGLTETCGGATIQYFDDPIGGHVGAPLACCEVKLRDCPELEYTSADEPLPRGEILLRGPHITQGYYKDPEATADVFDGEWFSTGDIGQWNKDGTLSIIDRKKNIFKLSQGEYVASEKLERIYGESPFASQVWVFGDSTESTLVCVVVPNWTHVQQWAEENAMDGSNATLCKAKKVQSAVLKDLQEVARRNKVSGFEIVRAVHLHEEEFTVEEGLVTPTFKFKRAALRKRFQDEITEMYQHIRNST